jgi:hypothetical protein
MKTSTFNSVIAAASFSMAVVLSSHAAAEQIQGQAMSAELSSEQVQFGATGPIGAAKTLENFSTIFTKDSNDQDMEVTTQAQSQAEALYKRHSSSGSQRERQTGLVHMISANSLSIDA